MKKTLCFLMISGIVNSIFAQAVVTASGNVRLNSSTGTRLVILGGISFTGTSNFIDNGRVDILTNPSGPASNWNDATAAGAYDATSTGSVFFSASGLQTITGPARFYDLTMNGATGISLGSDIEVRDNLFLNGGMFTTGANKVYVSNGATNAIQSTNSFASFINGRLERFTNIASQDYLMPIGKVAGSNIFYAPVRFNKINANSARYTGEYFRAIPFDPNNRLNPPIDHISSLEYWELTSDAPGGSLNDDAVLSLSWRASSVISANPADWQSIIIAHYRNNGGFRWEPEFNTSLPNNISGNASFGWVTSNVTVGSFTPPTGDFRFTLATRIPNNVLPVTAINWRAAAVNNAAIIDWAIENDLEVSDYSVERSTDGIRFSSVGKISSKQTASAFSYSFTDASPLQGWNYYRIRINDKTGSFAYTDIKRLQFNNPSFVKLYPIPTLDVLNVQLETDPLPGSSLQITDAGGRIVYQTNTVQRIMQLNVSRFTAGAYYVRYISNGNVQTYKFTKLN
ncbi:MAG: T9SS type A sorting domain-containing protein [Chitinophagaceae bacterium]|nr:T9SS type A sorting domain-containing protein [Chitinophagaceae bacterium]